MEAIGRESSKISRILVVDDLVDNLFLLKTVLEMEGYEVTTAINADAALAQMQVTQPDLLLLDVMMPGMTGYELSWHIRQQQKWHHIPIMLLTAGSQLAPDDLSKIGANGFIRKPIEFDELVEKIKDVSLTAIPC